MNIKWVSIIIIGIHLIQTIINTYCIYILYLQTIINTLRLEYTLTFNILTIYCRVCVQFRIEIKAQGKNLEAFLSLRYCLHKLRIDDPKSEIVFNTYSTYQRISLSLSLSSLSLSLLYIYIYIYIYIFNLWILPRKRFSGFTRRTILSPPLSKGMKNR